MEREDFKRAIQFLYSEKEQEEIIWDGEIKLVKRITSSEQLSVLSKIIFTNSKDYIYSSFVENVFSRSVEIKNYKFYQIGVDQFFQTRAFNLTEDHFKKFKIAELNRKTI